jgi:AraC-like DNA-binding protein
MIDHLAFRPAGRAGPERPGQDGGVAELLPPDRSKELADRSYRMVDYTWFRVLGRVRDLPSPHYLGHGYAYSDQYNIRTVWQAPMVDHVVVKIALSRGGVVGTGPKSQLRRLQPGEAVLRFVDDPDIWEAYDARQSKPWEFIGLILNGSVAALAARSLMNQYGRVYQLGLGHRLIRRLLDLSRQHTHVSEMSGLVALNFANTVFGALCASVSENPKRFQSVELAEAAEAMMRNNIAHDWTISELANRIGVSREHLTRAFADRHGVPPHRFLVELRIEEACRRLRFTSDPVKSIFLDLGFQSHTSFSRAFQRYHQVTPSEYREQRG